jgi:hypothetical protein
MKAFVFFMFLFSSIAVADECISHSRIRGFDAIDNTTLTIEAGRNDYTMTVSFCPELRWAQRIGFRTFSGARVCSFDRLLILDNFSQRIRAECIIRDIELNN